jgi:hypothetical protein
MFQLYQLVATHPAVALAQAALTLWMLVDAYRRGADSVWFWVILFFPVLGAWVYFFAVKAGDFRGLAGGQPLFQRRVSTEELRYQAEKVPTLANHLALAQRLIERHDHADALPHLEAALAREPDHCQVLYGLAVCYRELGQPSKALPYLERILERDRRWSDYAALRLAVAARAETGDNRAALDAGRELVRLAPTLQHQCILAERLAAEGLADEAWNSLQQSLETHRYAPGPSRRRNRAWARQAKRLQKRFASR